MPDGGLKRRRDLVSTINGVRYSFDSDGFRRGDVDTACDRQVLFVGDSWTEGRGVSDDLTFPAATRRSLLQRGVQACSLNAGMVGIGTAYELRTLRTLLSHRHVDAVVFQIFPLNDLNDNWADGGFGVEEQHLVEYAPARPPWQIELGVRYLRPLMAELVLARVVANGLLQPTFAAPLVDSTFELERLLLGEVAEIARRQGVPLLMVVVGHDRAECESVADAAPIPMYLPYRRVRGLVEDMDVPWVDTCQVAVADENFGVDDKHYSPAGNARVGEALAEKLAPLLARR